MLFKVRYLGRTECLSLGASHVDESLPIEHCSYATGIIPSFTPKNLVY